MDRKSLKVGLNQDRPDGVVLGKERNWRRGKMRARQEEEEISDTARQGYLECQGKNSGDRESLTVDINREGFLLEANGERKRDLECQIRR